MFGSKLLRTTLVGTTALLGAAAMDAQRQTYGATNTIATTTTLSQVVGTGDNLVVTSSGTIDPTLSTPAVTVNGAPAGFINNAGTITQLATGILVLTGSGLTGGITNTGLIVGTAAINNHGTISNTADAISVKSGGDIAGAISNSGTISGGGGATEAGVLVTGAGSTLSGITNTGTIQSGGQAIKVTGGGKITGAITNTGGTIQGVTATGTGIFVNGAGSTIHSVSNSGTIAGGTTGGAGINVGTGGSITAGIVNTGTIKGDIGINNAGSIVSVVTSAIIIKSGGDVLGGINNTGSITGNSGTMDAGILVTGAGSTVSSITNTGTIESGGQAINVNGGASITGAITNNIGGIIRSFTAVSPGTGINVNGTGSSIGSISNSGTIAGATALGGAGINVGAGGAINGGIANTGQITGFHGINNTGLIQNAAGNALTVSGGGDIVGGIINSGTFSGGAAATNLAIGVAGAGSTIDSITNSGTIASGGKGISVTGGGVITGAITNDTGKVIHGDAVTGTGIDVSGAGSAIGTIANSGTISGGTTSGTGVNIGAGAKITGGLSNGITNFGAIGGINNAGTISGPASGIFLKAGGDVTKVLTNSGTINGGTYGITLQTGNISGGLNNQAGGVISGVATGTSASVIPAFGINVQTSTITGAITNAGMISASATNAGAGGVAATGINVGGGSNLSGGIVNTGTITGIKGINVNASRISGGITNNAGGTIAGTGGTAIDMTNLTGITTITINGGTITGDIKDNAIASGFSQVVIGGNFSTSDDIIVSGLTVNAGSVLTVGAGDTITVKTLTFGVNGSTAGNFGSITQTGAPNLTGTTINVKVGVNPTLAIGDEMKVIDGTAAIVGGPGGTSTLVQDDSFLWNFRMVDGTGAATPTDNTDLFLQVVKSLNLTGLTQNNLNTLHTLNGLFGSTNPQILAVLGNVNGAPTAVALSSILDASSPTVDGSEYAGALLLSDTSLDFTGERLASLRMGDGVTGMAAGEGGTGLGAWGQVFGTHANQDARDGIKGYTANTWGVAMGVDTRSLSDRATMGLALSYGNTNADSDNANTTDTDVDSYQVTLYGDYDLGNRSYINGMAAYGWNSNDTTRHNVGGVTGLTAHGSFDAQQFVARAEAGKQFAAGSGILTPNLMAHWVTYDPDSYTETGAGGAGLHVDGESMDKFDIGAGFKMAWEFKHPDGSKFTPSVHAGYSYAVVNDRIEDTSSFIAGGGSFVTRGPDPSPSAINLGTRLKLQTLNNWDFTASYDFKWQEDYTAHAGFLRAGYRFK